MNYANNNNYINYKDMDVDAYECVKDVINIKSLKDFEEKEYIGVCGPYKDLYYKINLSHSDDTLHGASLISEEIICMCFGYKFNNSTHVNFSRLENFIEWALELKLGYKKTLSIRLDSNYAEDSEEQETFNLAMKEIFKTDNPIDFIFEIEIDNFDIETMKDIIAFIPEIFEQANSIIG